jgi:hypothetical protein
MELVPEGSVPAQIVDDRDLVPVPGSADVGRTSGDGGGGRSVPAPAGDFDPPRGGFPGDVAHDRPDRRPAVADVRIDLDLIEPDGIRRPQLHPADDAVPVGLRALVDGVGRPDRRELGVIDQHGDRMPAGRQDPGQVKNLRGAEGVFGAAIDVVGPDARGLGPFQEEGDPLASPGFGDDDVALVPGRAFPVPDPRKAVDDAFVLEDSLAVRVGRPGQDHRIVELFREPSFSDADSVGIEPEAPRPGEGDDARRDGGKAEDLDRDRGCDQPEPGFTPRGAH